MTALAWSPDGQLLAVASQDAPGFVLYDVSLGIGTPIQAGKSPFMNSPTPLFKEVKATIELGRISLSIETK